MYLDLETLREDYKIPSKEIIDSCMAVLLQSENKDETLTVAEQIAFGTLAHYKALVVEDKDKPEKDK